MSETEKIRKIIREILSENYVNTDLPGMVEIENVDMKDIDEILELCDTTFISNFDRACSENPNARIRERADWNKSIKLTVDDKIVGFYIFSNDTPFDFIKKIEDMGLDFEIEDEELYDRLKGKVGLEGVTVGIEKGFRKMGLGRKLLEYPKKVGVDYVWGVQSEGISDIGEWVKRRKILLSISAGSQSHWVTVEEF